MVRLRHLAHCHGDRLVHVLHSWCGVNFLIADGWDMSARVVKNDRNTPRGFTINTNDFLYFVLDTTIVLQDFSTCISFFLGEFLR